MGSAAEAMGLQLGDEVLVINEVDVEDRPVEGRCRQILEGGGDGSRIGATEVLSIVQAVNLVVLQIRKVRATHRRTLL